MASKLVTAYEEISGRQVRVPEHFIGHKRLGAGLSLEKPKGVEPVYDRSNPDAPGVSQPHTAAEISDVVANAPAGPSPVEIPDGEPSEKWSAKQLDAFADRAGIDLAGATTKADKVTAITASLAGPQDPDGDPSESGDSRDIAPAPAGTANNPQE